MSVEGKRSSLVSAEVERRVRKGRYNVSFVVAADAGLGSGSGPYPWRPLIPSLCLLNWWLMWSQV